MTREPQPASSFCRLGRGGRGRLGGRPQSAMLAMLELFCYQLFVTVAKRCKAMND